MSESLFKADRERELMKKFTENDWDKAEAIETEIGRQLTEGFTEDQSIKFVMTVMEIQKAMPDATIEGIYNIVLMAGVYYARLLVKDVPETVAAQVKLKRVKPRNRGVRGV